MAAVSFPMEAIFSAKASRFWVSSLSSSALRSFSSMEAKRLWRMPTSSSRLKSVDKSGLAPAATLSIAKANFFIGPVIARKRRATATTTQVTEARLKITIRKVAVRTRFLSGSRLTPTLRLPHRLEEMASGVAIWRTEIIWLSWRIFDFRSVVSQVERMGRVSGSDRAAPSSEGSL